MDTSSLTTHQGGTLHATLAKLKTLWSARKLTDSITAEFVTQAKYVEQALQRRAPLVLC